MWLLIAFINPLVLLLFWQGIFASKSYVGEWDAIQINSYYLFIIVASALLMQHVELQIANIDIYRGDLVRELLKPVSYFKVKFIAEFPWRFIQGFYAVCMVVFLVVALKKPVILFPHTEQLFLIFLIAVNAYFLSFYFKMVLGFFAFWLTNLYGLMESNDVLTIMLSGLVLPLELLPSWLQYVAVFTPYPYILHYPVAASIGLYSSHELIWVILIQLAWIATFFGLSKFMWSKGLKQFTGVGQ